jgi:hypothetical protein
MATVILCPTAGLGSKMLPEPAAFLSTHLAEYAVSDPTEPIIS